MIVLELDSYQFMLIANRFRMEFQICSTHCFLESMKRSDVIEPAAGHVLDEWYNRALISHRSKPHAISK